MQTDITGHHIDITDSLRDYVNQKMERVERHFDIVSQAHVILSVEKQRQKAEATLTFKGSKVFADAVAEDMYAAIDSLIDKLDRQVKKHKEKLTDHHRGEVSLKTHDV
ncbi:MAG: ribosome-associated translation inhibitor RaiA [gamma proteobacterium symbiont of Taylorina sp.]|nr:ribosome-associated translation inhibitor RaiA [gamma proteobacterium symbiont of Taylorina sp.]